jgi:hypothetical protein
MASPWLHYGFTMALPNPKREGYIIANNFGYELHEFFIINDFFSMDYTN